MPEPVIESSPQMEPSRILHENVAALSEELPGLSFGYIGNIESWGDDRDFRVFLPHPGRVGGLDDSVSLGGVTSLGAAVKTWPAIEARVRRLYANGSVRA